MSTLAVNAVKAGHTTREIELAIREIRMAIRKSREAPDDRRFKLEAGDAVRALEQMV